MRGTDKKAQYDLVITGSKPKEVIHHRDVYHKRDDSWYYYLGYIGEIGFAIALPIAGGAFIGKYLDERFQTYPKATLVGLFIGILISMVGFIKTVLDISNNIKKK